MEKDRQKLGWNHIWPELCSAVIVIAANCGLYLLRGSSLEVLLSHAVLLGVGIGLVGFHIRHGFLTGEFDYDNEAHYLRFWVWFVLGGCVAFVCCFLPVGGWPILPVFVVLSLFSNLSGGILAATVLLAIPVLAGGGSVEIFMLYFLCGSFAAVLFHGLDDDFRIRIPLFLSLFGLLLCEVAGIVLLQNARLSVEAFLIPATNMIISGVLLVGILKYFSSKVTFAWRVRYLELNDTEAPILSELREQSREKWLIGIHTAYFCERIAGSLQWDRALLKCVGYYHGLQDRIADEDTLALFPPEAREVLEEYWNRKQGIYHKEIAALVTADTIVRTVLQLRVLQEKPDYERAIREVFDNFDKKGSFDKSNLTLYERRMIQKIFEEEKLYYDFIH